MKLQRINATLLIIAGSLLVACNSDKSTPGYTYMDDMYVSPSLEPYQASEILPKGMEAQQPVDGTIPRGYVPYEMPNTVEAYEASKMLMDYPEGYAGNDEALLKDGAELYGVFCSHCHGKKGDGNGVLVQREKILGVPGYDATRLPDISPGSVYHVIMHGKGVMGSHASQLTYDERWKIVRYVWKLREDQAPKAE